MTRIWVAAALAAVIATGAGARLSALYARVETRTVPVDRLAANLENELQTRPKDADLHVRLARVYGMAYAMNAEEVPVAARPGRNEDVWFGYEPDLVPQQRSKPVGSRGAAAREWQRKSIQHYRTAVELAPTNLTARLGYAWSLEQSGEKTAAVPEYRRVIEQAWPKEQSARGSMPGQRFYTQEAAGYLIPLLNPERDAAEIADLRQRIDKLRALPRAVTPIAIPLTDHVVAKDIVNLDATVTFDADGAGLQRRWTWITPRAGWLVYDPDRKGTITSALQWFGSVTFWLFWNNGYEALASLDDDRDGELKGRELRYLAVWHDADGDGISDPGEVRPLAHYGITSLSCRWSAGDGVFAAAMSAEGVGFANGTTRPTYDVILRPSSSVSAP